MVSWPHRPALTAAGGDSGSAWLTGGGEVIDEAEGGGTDGIARPCGAAAIVAGEAIDEAEAGGTDGIARPCGAAAILGGSESAGCSESASAGEAGAGAGAPADDNGSA